MPKVSSVACAFIVFVGSATTSAADIQRWSVQLVGDTAVLRASKDTDYGFVKAAITALQEAGIERFTLRVMKPNDKPDGTKLTYSIQIVNTTAEITASTDLPYKYLEKVVSQLKHSGVTQMKLTRSGKSTGEAASQRESQSAESCTRRAMGSRCETEALTPATR